jgi:tRNA 2-selenouridine synthase
VLEELGKPHSLRVIGGYTGSGKTELLQALATEGQPVIDLEKIASHKGSAFGSIGLPKQPGQEQFENNLAEALHSLYTRFFVADDTLSALRDRDRELPPIWIEDESQRIGLVNLPGPFWTTMRNAPVYFLEIPFEERLSHIVEEYGALDKTALTDATIRITKKLGHLQARQVADLLAEIICVRHLKFYCVITTNNTQSRCKIAPHSLRSLPLFRRIRPEPGVWKYYRKYFDV